MPRYARAVIPGRPQDGRDLDRLVFGDHQEGYDELASEDGEYEEEDDEEEDTFVERAPRNRRRSGGRRREDYAALPDDHGAYAKEPSNGRGLMLLVGTLVICSVFGAVVWNAYSGGIRTAEASTAPMLQASGPMKTRPAPRAEPVESALNADVFDRMEEQPVAREPVRAAVNAPEPKPVEVAAAKPVVERPEFKPAPKTEPQPETRPVEVAKAEPFPAKPEPVVTREPVNAPTPLRAPPKPEPKVEAPADASVQLAGAYAPKFVPGAAHLVQIGATDTLEKADAEYARRARMAPDLFAGAERVVVPVQVNGTQMYRVRVGSFASAEDANAFCSAYKAQVGDCYRATR